MDTIGKKLALKEKMAYGCGDAASNIIWASTGTFLMFYYTDVVNGEALCRTFCPAAGLFF